MTRRESTVQGICVRLIRRAGWYAEKIHVDEMQSRGLPDVVACMAGLYYAIEFKRLGLEPTDMQKWHIAQTRNAGGHAGVIDTVTKMETVLICIKAGTDIPFLRKDARDDYW